MGVWTVTESIGVSMGATKQASNSEIKNVFENIACQCCSQSKSMPTGRQLHICARTRAHTHMHTHTPSTQQFTKGKIPF